MGVKTLIKLMQGCYSPDHSPEIEAMFRNRAEVFSDRLKWDVVVENGFERDRFDDEGPLYLISVDPNTGRYRGSLRLLPTVGPNMLRDVFPFLLRDGEIIESGTIWKSSRICTAPSKSQEGHRNGVGPALAELLAGIGEAAILYGWTQIVSVFDARVFRVLRAAGCNPQIIGEPMRIGKTLSFAGLFDTGEGPLQAIRDAVGIRNSVLAPHGAVRTKIEPPVHALSEAA